MNEELKNLNRRTVMVEVRKYVFAYTILVHTVGCNILIFLPLAFETIAAN